ncbi:type VI secretion system protein ImpE [Pseudoduganella lurida]|uniref:Type VI secretion system protein ImpE n=1 Tax=Pseudoduganella lurida TaxID=1036180 RepID=A0A562RKE3_9BURK|nr:type VI secretion system accessory protein TagJ [Pseudoduganella lurida]TWI69403.1 type VI secretion system protein ImpE [Pseudoduganella lurida]
MDAQPGIRQSLIAPALTTQTLIAQGRLDEALAALQDEVRRHPGDARHRIFLFQLLCVLGQWQRALTQLSVVAELDAGALPMVQTYREAIQCEALRAEIFAGKRQPLLFGEPEEWVAQLLEALRRAADGDHAGAARLREAAFDAAPATPGSIDGVPFAWLADADARLGPVIEAVVNGKYFWVPVHRIGRIAFEPPADLRDCVWTPATFAWTNGASTVGLIPTRYERTAAQADAALLLARRTEWVSRGTDSGTDSGEAGLGGHGLGQRMLVTDAGEYALMDVRAIVFGSGVPDLAAVDG